MTTQSLNTLCTLRNKVLSMIPETATKDDVWTYLGWDEKCSRNYQMAKSHGLDLRPIIAPVFSEVVSLISDGEFPLKGLAWTALLDDEIPSVKGKSAKEKIIFVIDTCIKEKADS